MILGKIANGYYYSFDNVYTAHADNFTSLKMSDSMFSEFMVSKDAINIVPTTEYPDEWNYKLIMHGVFKNGTLDAGNVSFNLQNTTDILIKRREKGTFKWQTIYHKKIETEEDFNFNIYDYYGRNNVVYEYAIVQVNGNIEGEYIKTECESKFEGAYLLGKDKIFELLVNLNVTRSMNAPRSFITGLNKVHPTTIKNSKAKYQKGNVSATIIGYNYDIDEFSALDAWKLRDEFLDFIYDGNAKFMKTSDNKANYIIEIEDGASEDGSHWYAPDTSFAFVQIGSAESEKDMAYAGLIDIDSEWWSV